MTTTWTMFWLIVGCAFVTWIPRILPFIFVKKFDLPDIVLRWLSYVPVCILSALVFESLVDAEVDIVTLDLLYVGALIPTLLAALFTKSLSKTVIVGVASMALLRYFF